MAYLRKGGVENESVSDICRFSDSAKEELLKVRKWVIVELHEETFDILEQKFGIKMFVYGQGTENEKLKRAMCTEVAINPAEPIIRGTLQKPFNKQLPILQRANRPVDGVVFTYPQTGVDAIAIAANFYKDTEINILPYFTRIGEDANFIAGTFTPNKRAAIAGHYSPYEVDGSIGLLCIALPKEALISP